MGMTSHSSGCTYINQLKGEEESSVVRDVFLRCLFIHWIFYGQGCKKPGNKGVRAL